MAVKAAPDRHIRQDDVIGQRIAILRSRLQGHAQRAETLYLPRRPDSDDDLPSHVGAVADRFD